jgi:NAD(P)-dependent dehydrogenase (short-subunit alcohol dehydrogenase family)
VSVAIVTGASRGIGRACAISLGERGFTVYVTGRGRADPTLPGTIERTAAEVTAAGGTGVAVACDHRDDGQVEALFALVAAAGDGLDLLVNNVFATDAEAALDDQPFFELPVTAIDDMLDVGLRAHYVAAWHAAGAMRDGGGGLIVNVSSAGAVYGVISPAYGIAKAGLDKFTVDAARQLAPAGITLVSLWPGPLVGTEMVERNPPDWAAVTESPFLTGRAVAALATDQDVRRFNGRVLVSADVAAAYGFTDADGTLPAYPFDDPQIARQLLRRAPLRIVT